MVEDARPADPQALQEAEYGFPYHYVPKWRTGFTQCFYDDWGIHYVSTIEFLLGRLRDLSSKSIVDVGCGDGRMTRELALQFPGRRVIGIDYSTRAIALAKALNPDLEGIEFSRLDITEPHDLPPSDTAILMEVFEHIPPEDCRDFLEGLRKLLQPGGTLLLTVPHVNQPLEPKHYRHFTEETIRNALSDFFVVKEVVPFERKGLRRRILRFVLGNRVFILNSRRLRNFLYRVYKRHMFHVRDQADCRRLFVSAAAR